MIWPAPVYMRELNKALQSPEEGVVKRRVCCVIGRCVSAPWWTAQVCDWSQDSLVQHSKSNIQPDVIGLRVATDTRSIGRESRVCDVYTAALCDWSASFTTRHVLWWVGFHGNRLRMTTVLFVNMNSAAFRINCYGLWVNASLVILVLLLLYTRLSHWTLISAFK